MSDSKELKEFRAKMRNAVADYMRSEGCSCCSDTEAHDLHEERLGQLLNVRKYPGSDERDFSRYETKKD